MSTIKTLTPAQVEAIAQADAFLTNAGLPGFTQVADMLKLADLLLTNADKFHGTRYLGHTEQVAPMAASIPQAPARKAPDITLHAEHGMLHHGESLMLHRYMAGDCDTAPWPLKSDMDRLILARALYDHRECSDLYCEAAILPDGTRFVIEDELIKHEAARKAADAQGF